MTLTIKDLKIGEYYYGQIMSSYIFTLTEEGGYWLTNHSFGTEGASLINQSLRLATNEEKQWLNACIKANKFIPKEEALKSKTKKVEDLCYPYEFSDIIFPNKEEYNKQAMKENKTDIKIGDIVEITVRKYGHGFSIGEKVEILKIPEHEGDNYYATNNSVSWYILPDEFKKLEENKEWWKELKKGDFVVSLEKMGNTRGKDTIHEIYENFYSCISYYRLDYPLNNGTSTSFNEFRPATEQEIALYKAHGKPVHINTPFPAEKVSKEPEITVEQLREMAKSLVDRHREKIRQKLEELFAPNITSLNKKYYKVFFDFLNGLSTKEMTKEELLAEAKRRYPVGCFVNSLGGVSKSKVTNSKFSFRTEDAIENHGDCLVYLEGKWAEIISLPESSKEGSLKHYVCETCNGEGKVMSAKLYPSGHTEVWENCPCCNGDGERYIIGIDPISSCKKTKNILLLGEFEPIIINEYKEYGINNLI